MEHDVVFNIDVAVVRYHVIVWLIFRVTNN